MNIYKLKVLAVFFLISLWGASGAYAHRVLVYAWVEGDTVFTESKFNSGRKAQNCDVFVYNKEEKLLVTGKTDTEGNYSFKVPEKSELKVVLEAGTGHRGEWVIPREEVDESAAGDEVEALSKTATIPPAEKASASASVSGSGLTADDLAAIERIVDRKVGAVKLQIADLGKPSAKDIFGGIGYILGLVGIGAYVNSRKKS